MKNQEPRPDRKKLGLAVGALTAVASGAFLTGRKIADKTEEVTATKHVADHWKKIAELNEAVVGRQREKITQLEAKNGSLEQENKNQAEIIRQLRETITQLQQSPPLGASEIPT